MGRTLQELKDANARVDAATNAIGSQVGQVITNEAEQLAEIQRLKDQVAAGSPVTAADLDGLVENSEGRAAALETIKTNLTAIASDPANPLPEPDPVDLPPTV